MLQLLEIKDVGLTLGSFKLGELSLELNSGDYFVLLGPSGCGKTTLLRTIAGVYREHRGCIRMAGTDMTNVPPEHRHVGYVSQNNDLFPHLNVWQNVAFGLRYTKWDIRQQEEQLQRILELIGISHLLEQSAKTLSGGESRRVALARALAVNPRVLLLDEPLGMLDPNARQTMIATLKRIHQETNTATIQVTHDREEAWMLDAWCGVMINGQLLQTGSAAEVFRRPGRREVADFLGGTNIFKARFEKTGTERYAVTAFSRFILDRDVPDGAGEIQMRPETLRPGHAVEHVPESCYGTITVVVRSIQDRGAYLHIETETETETPAQINVHTGHAAGDYTPGDRVCLFCQSPPQPLEPAQEHVS